jgi:glutathione synthase/RimK-type ligase-like ATP-grasp enzyme
VLLLIGIPSEDPLAMVAAAAAECDLPFLVVSLRAVRETGLVVRVGVDGGVDGVLQLGSRRVAVEDVTGAYLRLVDVGVLPELADTTADAGAALARAHAFVDAVYQWAEISPARIVNRPSAMGSNGSKPFQARLAARCGFDVPETLVTNDPEEVMAFRDRVGSVIYKSTSGVRSIVQTLGHADLRRLASVRWCPTQFQEEVPGFDVRVHVVAEEVFATRVRSAATDYRYAARQVGEPAQLAACTLPDDVAARCVALTAELGLAFSGVDLRFAPDGRVVCFEVNPCPGFSYYEHHTGQPIAAAVARYLGGRSARVTPQRVPGRPERSSP